MALKTDGPAMAKRNQLQSSTAFGLQLDPTKLGEQIATGAQPAPRIAASQTAGDSASKRSLNRIKWQRNPVAIVEICCIGI
jgi:hypothetical protein